MPDFFEVARSQRGTAYYKPDPISDDVLHQILEAATRAPSGSNRQPWRFIVMRDREVKRQMGEWYREAQRRMTGAAPTREGDGPVHFSIGMEDIPVLVMVCVEMWQLRGSETYRGASVYPAAQNLMLAAAAFGLGTRLTTIWQHCYEDVAVVAGRTGGLGDDGDDPDRLPATAGPPGRQPPQTGVRGHVLRSLGERRGVRTGAEATPPSRRQRSRPLRGAR